MMCRGFGKRRWGFSQRQSPQSSRLLGAKLGGVSGMENTFLLGALTLFFMSLPPSFFFLSLLYFVSFFFPKTPNKTEKVVVGFRYARRNLFFLLPCGRTFPWSATWLLTIFSYHCHRIFFYDFATPLNLAPKRFGFNECLLELACGGKRKEKGRVQLFQEWPTGHPSPCSFFSSSPNGNLNISQKPCVYLSTPETTWLESHTKDINVVR